MEYVNQNGESISLGNPIGRAGGEGKVFAISDDPTSVAKIYHTFQESDKLKKLLAMRSMAQPQLLAACAWPTQLIFSKASKNLIGVVMPKVLGHEIHKLYNPRDRYQNFPKVTWRGLVRVARNVAAAFDTLHAANIVMADVNEGNVLVEKDSTVKLIDCDSYQLSHAGKTFICDVGIGLWTPPELQNVTLSKVIRTKNHDLFGLAQIIFHILFMGRHPFVGRPKSPKEYELEESIKNFIFAYVDNSHVIRPEISLSLSNLPEEISSLFRMAFLHGSQNNNARPTAKTWIDYLELLEKNLRKCSQDSGHYFAVGNTLCPWCELQKKHHINYFWTAGTPRDQTDALQGIESIISLINRTSPLEKMDFVNISVDLTKVAGTPCQIGKINPLFYTGWALFTTSVLLLFHDRVLGFGGLCVSYLMIVNGKINRAYEKEEQIRTQKVEKVLTLMTALLQQAENIFLDYHRAFKAEKEGLEELGRRIKNFASEKHIALAELEQKKKELQLDEYLDKCHIADASISNIGDKRKATLAAYGVETAFDISKSISVPGFGPSLISELIYWRNKCISNFRYNPNIPLPAQVVQEVHQKLEKIALNLKWRIQAGPENLKKLSYIYESKKKEMERRYAELLLDDAQTKADLSVMCKK